MNESQRQIVGPWTLHEHLGRGGNATVWRATRSENAAAVAVKLINTTKVERPAHYTAYEMILNPATADPHPADVYSLGKTLWVLATGQAFPPEGHQPAGTRGFGIDDFRPHPHAASLDQQVDLMTRLHSDERPTKDQVARDLGAWQELS